MKRKNPQKMLKRAERMATKLEELDLDKEYQLIQERKSNLSSAMRKLVIATVEKDFEARDSSEPIATHTYKL